MSKQSLDEKIETIGTMQQYTARKNETVNDLLNNLGLSDKYFAIVVNGKKVGLDYEIKKEEDKIVILPKIAGGIEKYFN